MRNPAQQEPDLGDDGSAIRRGVRKLSDEDIRRVRGLHDQGRSCREYGVAHTTITRLVNGQQWADYLVD